MPDLSVIERLLHNLDAYLAALQQERHISREQYLDDSRVQAIVERRLEEAIQTSIDTGNHLIAQNQWTVPATNREVFAVLREQGVLPRALEQTMADLAGFRNVLAHEYARLNHERVFEIFQQSQPTFAHYRCAIIDFLQRGR